MVDQYQYKGWLNSDSFLKRCFGVLLHGMVANIILSLVLAIPIFLIMMLAGGAALLAS